MKISIVVATYNGEKYLSEQLNSFMKQSILPDEIVISDDNSMDNTIKIAKEFAANCSCMVKIIKNEKNHGVTGNFENAAKHATGDIVFFSDQDDVWYDNKIKEMLFCFEKYPGCVGVFCDADCVDSNLNKMNATFNDGCWNKFKKLNFDADGMCLLKGKTMASEVVKGNILGGCCLAIRNKFLKQMFDFCPSIYHDDWLCFCMFSLGDVVALNKALFAYRLHGNNTVGFENIVKKKISKKDYIKKIVKKLKNLDRLYITEADRAIYFQNFSQKHNCDIKGLNTQISLVKANILAATSSKYKGIKQMKQIYISIKQYKSDYYYLKCLYILLHSKKCRNKQLKKYLEILNKY